MNTPVNILFSFSLLMLITSQAWAEDHILRQSLNNQMSIWNTQVKQGMGSRKCHEEFKQQLQKQIVLSDIPSSWNEVKRTSEYCKSQNDRLGEGLIWVHLYLLLSADAKTQILNRSYILSTIYMTSSLLSDKSLDPTLKASLTALATELAHNDADFKMVILLTSSAEEQFTKLGLSGSLSLVTALANQGYAKKRLGDPNAGLHDLLRAEKMLRGLGEIDEAQLAVIYRRLASVYDMLQQDRQSLRYGELAKALFDKFDAKIHSANISFNKGVVLLDIGLYDQAIEAFSEAKNTYLVKGMEKQVGSCFFNLGKVWYQKGNKERAMNFYEQAVRLLESSRDYVELAKVYNSMGIFHENQMTVKGYQDAMVYYLKSEDLYRKYAHNPESHLRALAINKGKLYERLGNYDDAFKEYLYAKSNMSDARMAQKFIIYNNLAYVSSLKQNNEDSLKYAQTAIQYLDEVLDTGFIFGGEQNLHFIDQHLSSYFIAIGALIAKGELKAAYALRHKTRSRLFQMMVRTRDANHDSPETEKFWQEKASLERELSDIEKRATQNISDNEKLQIHAKRRQLKVDIDSVHRKIFSNPALYQKIFTENPLDVSDIQKSLNNNEAILDYHLSAEFLKSEVVLRITAFVIKRGSIKHIILAGDEQAMACVDSLDSYNNLHKPKTLQEYYRNGKLDAYGQFVHEGAKKQYACLIHKMESDLQGVGQLYIISDGDLGLLPFETLIDHNDRLLIEKYQISYLNTAADLLDGSVNASQNMLIFGDIDYGKHRSGMREWKGISGSEDFLAGIMTDMKTKIPVSYFNKSGATENKFKQTSSGNRIVFIWSHGEYSNYSVMPDILAKAQDEQGGLSIKDIKTYDAWRTYEERHTFTDPLSNSFLVLAGVNSGGDGTDNGYLTAREVMGLDLKGTELTILAACETGVGQLSPSEGVMGLRKAFSLAGSKQVLISLWRVDVKWTGELIKQMLINYDKHGGPRALQEAKLAVIKKLRKQGLEPYPFYWSGFILVGRNN